MSKISRKLTKWIENADDADDLASEIGDYLDIDEDHEDYDLLLAICERLMPQDDSDTSDQTEY